MRARSLRPVFDRLDTRLVLDGGTAAVCGGSIGTSVVVIMSNNNPPSGTTVSGVVDWNLPGSPQDAPDGSISLVASSS
jgi:hypothetical protein